jgi:aminodeoxyfutalosine synthase
MSLPEALDETRRRIETDQRVDYRLAKALLLEAGLDELGGLADLARRRRVGDKVYFINNYHLYYTNICIWKCKFCAFSRRPAAADAYTKTIDDILAEIGGLDPEISEIRVTGGINPRLELPYYKALLSCIRDRLPEVHIEAFAPTEIAFIARQSGLSVEGVLKELRQAGLGSLTSGGAEIFNPALRKRLCPRKPSIRSWLEVNRTAHRLGIPSNASILFGHLETHDDWLRHLLVLRRLQDETGGFNSFIPLAFLPENTGLSSCPPLDFSQVLRMMAISRIVLDNFNQLKFLWLYYGSQRIQQALSFGVNDLAGTAYEKYRGVARSAGSGSPAYLAKSELIRLIKDCRRLPVERGKLYEEG